MRQASKSAEYNFEVFVLNLRLRLAAEKIFYITLSPAENDIMSYEVHVGFQ